MEESGAGEHATFRRNAQNAENPKISQFGYASDCSGTNPFSSKKIFLVARQTKTSQGVSFFVEESGCGLVTIIVACLNQSHVPAALLLPPGLSEYYEAPFRANRALEVKPTRPWVPSCSIARGH